MRREEGYSPIDGSLGRVDGFCCSLLECWKRRRYLSVKGHTEVPCDCEETRLQESDQGKCALFRSRLSPNPLVETPSTLRTPRTIAEDLDRRRTAVVLVLVASRTAPRVGRSPEPWRIPLTPPHTTHDPRQGGILLTPSHTTHDPRQSRILLTSPPTPHDTRQSKIP